MVGKNTALIDPLFRAMIRAGAIGATLYFAALGDIVHSDGSNIDGISLWAGPGQALWSTYVASI